VGGFGVPGQPPYPGGPGWTAPGGAGPQGGGNSKKKNLIITAVAVLVLVVVVAVVLVVALGGDDTSTASGGSSSSTSAAPSTSSSASSGGFSSAPSGSADAAGFIGQLPADFTDCAGEQLAGDGDVAAASCGAALTQPGPAEAEFYRYPDATTLASTFQSHLTDEGLTEFVDGSTCSTGTGYGPWTYTDGTPGGQVGCQITGDGHVLVAWTDDEFLTEGVVQAPGTTQAEVSALYDWWTANSEYQG
jgi:preprotein translocase subunit SecG